MAAALTPSARATVVYLIDYISNSGSYGLPIDHNTADQLGRHYASFGYDSRIKFMEDLRDQPTVTFLSILLHLSDAV
jgi:hypothetical protein